MKNLNKVFAVLAIFFAIVLSSSCAQSLSPADRYAKEHSGKTFKGWDELKKDWEKNDKRKVKDPKGTIGQTYQIGTFVEIELTFEPLTGE
jgi:hypothetical protein